MRGAPTPTTVETSGGGDDGCRWICGGGWIASYSTLDRGRDDVSREPPHHAKARAAVSRSTGVLGGRKLFTPPTSRALYEALQCPSSSSDDPAARTGTSTEPSEASLYARAQELLTKRPRKRSGRGGNGRSSNVVSLARRRPQPSSAAAVSYLEAGGERTLPQADHRPDRLDAAGEDRPSPDRKDGARALSRTPRRRRSTGKPSRRSPPCSTMPPSAGCAPSA